MPNVSDAAAEGFEINEMIGPRLEKNTIIEVSADPLANFVRFTEGSGYTQFSGYWTTIVSQFHQSQKQFKDRAKKAWPLESPDTVPVLTEQMSRTVSASQVPVPRTTAATESTDEPAAEKPDVIRFQDHWNETLQRRSPE